MFQLRLRNAICVNGELKCFGNQTDEEGNPIEPKPKWRLDEIFGFCPRFKHLRPRKDKRDIWIRRRATMVPSPLTKELWNGKQHKKKHIDCRQKQCVQNGKIMSTEKKGSKHPEIYWKPVDDQTARTYANARIEANKRLARRKQQLVESKQQHNIADKQRKAVKTSQGTQTELAEEKENVANQPAKENPRK